MRKIVLFTAIFVFIAAFLIIGGQQQFTGVLAQDDPAEKNTVTAASENDRELAALIKRLTDRSGEGLVERRRLNGSYTVDLGEKFQNVMLGRIGGDGEPAAACVTSLGEANEFFGRDLETGAPIVSPVKDETAAIAARHGMSKQEFEFYKKLIDDFYAHRAASPESAAINIVNGDGASEGFNDPTAATPEGGNTGTTRGSQRLLLFQFAASIWGTFLDSSVVTNVNSQFNSLTPCNTSGGVLGSAGTTTVDRDFFGAQFLGTWHHAALVNKLAGADSNGSTAEINARFNTDVDNGCLGGGSRFYYGFNNTTPNNRVNLLIVLLHEMGHGLGFSSFVNGSSGAMFQGLPDVYLLNMVDRLTNKRWDAMTNSERQLSAINSGAVYFDGPNVKIASLFMTAGRASDGAVLLHTPTNFSSGSSISHFSTFATPDLLMEPNISLGLPLDLDLTKQAMRDVGWFRDTNTDGVPDTITNVTMGGPAVIGNPMTVRWTNTGGFDKNVAIELSTDGGATFPTVLASDNPNSGTFTCPVPNLPTTTARIRVRETGYVDPMGSTANFTIGLTAPVNDTPFDYDGDHKSDISIFRPSNGVWFVQNSSNGTFSINQWGTTGDMTAPADYDGDGKTDLAVFRPSNGVWFWINSSNGTVGGNQFGVTGDRPVPGDFDGDDKADIAIFRPSTGTWWIFRSSDSSVSATPFGVSEDKPVIGDFDGDGKTDLAVFRPSAATWFRLNSTNGAFVANAFGLSEDKPVPGDYDGDGKTDISIWRPSNGAWYVLNSSNGEVGGVFFGLSEDRPTPGDYDGDGKADFSVFRPSQNTWYMLRSTAGFTAQAFGADGDTPTPNSFVQ